MTVSKKSYIFPSSLKQSTLGAEFTWTVWGGLKVVCWRKEHVVILIQHNFKHLSKPNVRLTLFPEPAVLMYLTVRAVWWTHGRQGVSGETQEPEELQMRFLSSGSRHAICSSLLGDPMGHSNATACLGGAHAGSPQSSPWPSEYPVTCMCSAINDLGCYTIYKTWGERPWNDILVNLRCPHTNPNFICVTGLFIPSQINQSTSCIFTTCTPLGE